MIDLVCVDGLLFLKDDVLDADPSRSRGFRPSAPSSIGRRPGCVVWFVLGPGPVRCWFLWFAGRDTSDWGKCALSFFGSSSAVWFRLIVPG